MQYGLNVRRPARFRRFSAVLLVLLSSTVLVVGCGGDRRQAEAPKAAQTADRLASDAESIRSFTPGYLELFEGLHVTGQRKDVDAVAYRLRVVGAVDSPLELSFDEIQSMQAEDREVSLVCPGFFEDNGIWTGVPLSSILEMAGVRAEATSVRFEELDGMYFSRLALDRAMGPGVLIAYRFNGEELHPAHGFPVRLVAEGEEGNVWVKWLGTIRVQ